MYVINKQLIINVFGTCPDEYVEELKRQVNKSLIVQTLHSYRLALANSSTNQWNTNSLGLPYFVRYPTTIPIVYQRGQIQYFNNKNVITLVKKEKGQKVDSA
jgi:hypothetical protein